MCMLPFNTGGKNFICSFAVFCLFPFLAFVSSCTPKAKTSAHEFFDTTAKQDSAFFKRIDSLEDKISHLVAIKSLDSASERLTEGNNYRNAFFYYKARAWLVAKAGNIKKAVAHGLQALDIAEQKKDTSLLIHAHHILSGILVQVGDSAADKYFDKALILFKHYHKDSSLYWKIIGNMGVYEMMITQQYDRARFLFKEELEHSPDTDKVSRRGAYFSNITGIYQFQNKLDSALLYCDSTIALWKQNNKPYNLAMSFHNKANILYDLNRFQPALACSDSAALLYREDNVFRKQAAYLRYLLLKAMNKPREAMAAMEEYDRVRNLIEDARSVQIADLLASEEKVTSIEKKMADKDLQHQLTNQKNQRTAIILGSGLVILLLMLMYIYKSEVKKRKLALGNLKQTENLLQERSSLLEQMRQNTINRSYEDEMNEFRSKLSMELHDNVAGALAGMKFKLSMLPPTPLTGEVIENIGNIYDKVRSISHGLVSYKPTADFPEEIRRLVLGYLRGLPVQANLSVANETELNNLPNRVKEQIHLIIQEILTNVIKHSGASSFGASISVREQQVYLEFTDNGRGYEVEKTSGGIGLQNINRRLKELNGVLVVSSGQNHGAKTDIRIPVMS